MAADEVIVLLNLFDSCWFGQEIVTPKTNSSHDDDHQLVQEIETTKDDDQSMNYHNDHHLSFSLPPSLNVRSLSDHQCLLDSKSSFFSSSADFSFSPSSVLAAPKLQTISSGKEVKDFGHDTEHEMEQEQEQEQEMVKKEEVAIRRVEEVLEQAVSQEKIKKKVSKKSTRKNSKSLSDLEFEELKGFLDLGFVFTEEECKDRKLVSMIPGLQRFGKKCSDGSDQDKDNHDYQEDDKKKNDEIGGRSEEVISRPYLSEAWNVLDLGYQGKKETKQVVNWKIPTLVTDVDMKDQLRFWAHTVASTVR